MTSQLSWRQRVFALVTIGSVLFVVLTVVAMLFYPGSTVTDHTTVGYSFSTNYFSDLGLTRTYAEQPNTLSAILFITALALGGAGIALFFLAFRQFFDGSRPGKLVSGIGSFFGAISGICFMGVAFTPANLYLIAHLIFVLCAFGTFAIAVICYTVAIFCEPNYPNRFGFVFVAFAVLLVIYIFLLIIGPPYDSPEGNMIQAIGQKIIVYASVISIFIQANGANKIEPISRQP